MKTARDKNGRFAKQPTHNFQVGDLVDIPLTKGGYECSGGRIKEIRMNDDFPFKVFGSWKRHGKDLQPIPIACRLSDVFPHVSAPKAEPVKAPAEERPAPVTEKDDALEAAKREAYGKYGLPYVKDAVEIGFRAGQKAAQGEPFTEVSEKALEYFQKHIGVGRFDDIGKHIVEMFRGVGCLDKAAQATRVAPSISSDEFVIATLEAKRAEITKREVDAIAKARKEADEQCEAINAAIAILKGGA